MNREVYETIRSVGLAYAAGYYEFIQKTSSTR